MKKALFLTFALFVTSSSAFATIVDNAPEWRGLEGSTYQSWEFLTDANPTTPDVYDNPYGEASLLVTGSEQWYQTYMSAIGVWKYEDNIIIEVDNNPVANPYKEVWLQITYAAATIPDILIIPEGGSSYEIMRPIDVIDLGNGYYHATFQTFLQPNPSFEIALIQPSECVLYVDDITLETICVPEPATMALLSVGLLLLKKK